MDTHGVCALLLCALGDWALLLDALDVCSLLMDFLGVYVLLLDALVSGLCS